MSVLITSVLKRHCLLFFNRPKLHHKFPMYTYTKQERPGK